MFGYDKYSRDDRVKWTDAHIADIRGIVKDPIGNTWWHSAEEPWQFLAACLELASALDSPNPAEYVSNVPVQQDGSCNGLQHYAALGGDVQGAKQVNLAPSPAPQDVYAAVAKLVEAKILKDVEAGHPMAIALTGKITRKIIKQPVMTNVYGVTPYGARLQILARLKEGNLLPANQLEAGASYLTTHVMSTLKHLFDRAQAIQDWLTDLAKDVGRSVSLDFAIEHGYKADLTTLPTDRVYCSTPKAVNPKHKQQAGNGRSKDKYRYPQTSLTWTTPLGFQICQPYLDPGTRPTKTCLQNSVTIPGTITPDTPVNENRQTSAFPPNFVHSLDATHMFMTAIACYNYPSTTITGMRREGASIDNDDQQDNGDGGEGGIAFASVHDCFWTHAATVDVMNRVLREQFVELYSRPILRDLAVELRAMYPNFKIPVVVKRAPHKGGMEVSPSEGELAALDDGIARKGQLIKGWMPLVIRDPPERGEFDLKEVLRSEYFFS